MAPRVIPPTVTDTESPLRFRGQIDRIDLSTDGRSVLVIDYKTGKPDYFRGLDKDAIDRGKHLQLAIYSPRRPRNIPQRRQVRAAYWFATTKVALNRSLPSTLILATPRLWSDSAGPNHHSDSIRAGAFPANPGPPTGTKMPTAPIATSMPSAPPAAPTSGTGRSMTPFCLVPGTRRGRGGTVVTGLASFKPRDQEARKLSPTTCKTPSSSRPAPVQVRRLVSSIEWST